MNKRENVRAAVDMHCLGLSPSQAQPTASTQAEATHAEAEAEHPLPTGPGVFTIRVGGGYSLHLLQPPQTAGPEAAGHLALGTLSGPQLSGGSTMSDVPLSSGSQSGAPSARRSSRFRPSQFEAGPSTAASHPELPELDQPPSAGGTAKKQFACSQTCTATMVLGKPGAIQLQKLHVSCLSAAEAACVDSFSCKCLVPFSCTGCIRCAILQQACHLLHSLHSLIRHTCRMTQSSQHYHVSWTGGHHDLKVTWQMHILLQLCMQ